MCLCKLAFTDRSTGGVSDPRLTFAKLFLMRIEICGDSARLSGNYVIAMKWWHRAADRGNAPAQMRLPL